METKIAEGKELVEVYISVTKVDQVWRAQWRYRGMNWERSRFGNGFTREWKSKKSAENYIRKAFPEAQWVD